MRNACLSGSGPPTLCCLYKSQMCSILVFNWEPCTTMPTTFRKKPFKPRLKRRCGQSFRMYSIPKSTKPLRTRRRLGWLLLGEPHMLVRRTRTEIRCLKISACEFCKRPRCDNSNHVSELKVFTSEWCGSKEKARPTDCLAVTQSDTRRKSENYPLFEPSAPCRRTA